MVAAETFLDGGTDYETPLREALHLMKEEGFENADVVFITDGYCELPETFQDEQICEQIVPTFRITGILLDTDIEAGDFSLQPFCQTVYRSSEVFQDEIVKSLISQRV